MKNLSNHGMRPQPVPNLHVIDHLLAVMSVSLFQAFVFVLVYGLILIFNEDSDTLCASQVLDDRKA